jgi:hypothetical protein
MGTVADDVGATTLSPAFDILAPINTMAFHAMVEELSSNFAAQNQFFDGLNARPILSRLTRPSHR